MKYLQQFTPFVILKCKRRETLGMQKDPCSHHASKESVAEGKTTQDLSSYCCIYFKKSSFLHIRTHVVCSKTAFCIHKCITKHLDHSSTSLLFYYFS